MTFVALAAAFFVTALLYSSVGFGGGSTYNALLALSLADLTAVPVISLTCNIIVVLIGSWRFMLGGHIVWDRFWPLALLSVPAAFVGGLLPLPPWIFVGLLAVALAVSGLLMLWQPLWRRQPQQKQDQRQRAADLASGASLGLLAGITGIGGGIYLSPLLHLRRWGPSREIAGTCAAFILINSIGGLAGQFLKGGSATLLVIQSNWPLFPAVAAGGLLGSTLGTLKLSDSVLRIMTALLILYVAVRLGVRFPTDWANRR